MSVSDRSANDPAPALGRGIAILHHLQANGSCSLEQLARHFQWPKASLLRLTESLGHAGVVQRDPVTKRYHSLVQLVTIASVSSTRPSGQSESQPATAATVTVTAAQDRTPCLV